MRDRKLTGAELGRVTPAEYSCSPASGLAVMLDNVRSAHNVGSAFRSADAFRVDKMVLCGISACPPGAEIHKTALGAEYVVPWEHKASAREAVEDLRGQGYTIVAVEQTENSVKLDRFVPDTAAKYAFIFGNEVDGVSQAAVDAADFSIEIPQFGTKHSLNVSVCVGIVLWAFTEKTM